MENQTQYQTERTGTALQTTANQTSTLRLRELCETTWLRCQSRTLQTFTPKTMLRELLQGSELRFKDAKAHPIAYRELKGYMRLFLLETAKKFGTASTLTAESAMECVELIMEYQHYCTHTYENWVDFLYRFTMGEFGKVYNNLCVQSITAAYSIYACGETPEQWRDGFNHKFGVAIAEAKNAVENSDPITKEIWGNKFKQYGL